MKDKKHDRSSIYACLVMGLLGLIIFVTFPHSISKISAEEITAQVITPTLPPPDYFAPLQLQAKAAFVYDLSQNKVLFSKDADTPLPLASLTKMMTAITAIENAPTSTIVTINKDDLLQDGDSGLLLGERWQLDDLLKFTLVVSSNDGAAAVADALGSHDLDASSTESISQFVGLMNVKAKEIGLENTVFFNPTGLDQSTTLAGSYGSARDVEKTLAYAVMHHEEIFTPTKNPTITVSSLDGFSHTGDNTNILTSSIPNVIAGKTGNTDLAGGNLAVMFDAAPNHRLIIVVLGSTYDGRFQDMQKLVDAATTTLSQK